MITNLKARLVARGFTQIPHLVHRQHPLNKLVLAVANKKELSLYHYDVEVCMKLPDGCGVRSKRNASLEKAIYGLQQSGREWGRLCADTLTAEGFKQCRADPCISHKIIDGLVIMTVGVYADDLLVGGSEEDFEELLESLNKKFRTKNLGVCTWYDGCSVERDCELSTLKISREAYVEHLMKGFEVKSIRTSRLPPAMI